MGESSHTMFRRILASAPTRALAIASVAGGCRTVSTSSSSGIVAPTPIRLQAPSQSQDGNAPQNRGDRGNQRRPRPANLPPAFDIFGAEDSIEKGYMMRVQYMQNCVVLNYMKQVLTREQAEEPASDGKRKMRFDMNNKVVVFLPTMFIARFLGVLEGTSEQCDIASRTTQGKFTRGESPNTFLLSCTSTRTEGQEPMKWECEIDPASALCLQRFLVQALHHNSGFE